MPVNFCDEDGDGTVSCTEGMRATGKVSLLIVTLVWFLLGVVLLVVGINSYTYLEQFEGINTNSITLTCCLGGALILSSLSGAIGVLKMDKILLGVFSVITAILAVGILILGVILSSFIALVDSVGSDSDLVLAAGTQPNFINKTGNFSGATTAYELDPTKSQEWIANYFNCSFNACCPYCDAIKDTEKKQSSAAALGKKRESTITSCRKGAAICHKVSESSFAEIQPAYCAALVQGGVHEGDSCSSLSLHRSKEKQFLRRHVNTISISSISSFGVILLTLAVSCYFTSSTKVKHIEDKVMENYGIKQSDKQ